MTRSAETRIALIEAWFRAHEDGEFCEYPSDHMSVLTGDHFNARTVIYTTKSHCIPQLHGLTLEAPVATIGRYGLPNSLDLALLSNHATSVNRVFIGDADPPDLLVFSWLREHVPILWYGVNDDFLIRHDHRTFDGVQIALSDSERETVQKLPQLCPDFRELLGKTCSSLLDDGFKIELEGAIMVRNDCSQK